MEFPLAGETFRRLPKHPDWRWEYWDGAAHLSHRPRPLGLVRPTATPVEVATGHPVRDLRPAQDRHALEDLLWAVWRPDDLYRLAGENEARDLLRQDLDRTLAQGQQPPGVVVAAGEGLAGALLLLPGIPDDQPTLTWLSVRGDHRMTGMATAMLAAVVTSLRSAGHDEVFSAVSPANAASLRWHWSRGFTPLPLRPWERAARW